MEILGETVKQGTCRNCGRPMALISWGGAEPEWCHTDPAERRGGGMQGYYCAGAVHGEPEESDAAEVPDQE